MSWLKPASNDSGSAASSVSSRRVLEVGRDALRAGHHVAMGQHDALGLAGAARRVEDRRHVGVDDAVAARGAAPVSIRLPADGPRRRSAAHAPFGLVHDDVPQVRTLGQRPREQRQALGRRDQHAHVAVAQDVGHLLRLEQRIERHEHAAGGRGAEHRDDGLDALFEIDADAFGSSQCPSPSTPAANAATRSCSRA